MSHIAVFLTALCWGKIAWILYLFRRHLDLEGWQAAVMGLVVMASARIDLLGMEAYLFAFLLTLSIALFYRRAWLLAGASAYSDEIVQEFRACRPPVGAKRR